MTTSTTSTRESVSGGAPILASVRDRFGGIDTPAALAGTMTALGVLVFLTALIAAGAATFTLQMDLLDVDGVYADFDAAGFVTAAVVVFASFVVGGWAAGRMARYDGGINGIATAIWMLVLVVGFAAAGAFIGEEYNAFAAADLPDWMSQVSSDDATAMGIAAAVIAVAVMFLGGWVGGRLGETWHRRVDAAVAHAALETAGARSPVAGTTAPAAGTATQPVDRTGSTGSQYGRPESAERTEPLDDMIVEGSGPHNDQDRSAF